MKLPILAFALSMPLAAMASATPMLQERRAAEPGTPATPARPHQPLFIVKYVLVDAPPEAKDVPRLDPGDGRAAIHAVPLSGGQWPVVPLGTVFRDPNMYVCSSWGCRGAH
ncbi:hypothetical protein RHOFW510R12_19920 [Rhodanobacter sp. FW510-R12]|uniref:hypothetical protein n=1 Tax=unclassified Rhodanobacter TaxID=2621553 RepID=UPI0007AA4B04|nr:MULTISPECIES: hypothetical protein [unclassified Rhodanobacter]KZC18432.1 hypothetical protein RHOFW104R8_06220 [Rhodanobacter sp. FW104-R8]KZC28919.1 hypothetical protein RhoFW510T8_08875 [Rhodanobacter sp. FW510-T8]KZC29786.1 hypothetical protein RhoFW510R10_04465 [Rhodanobacter sp. FW510-R10]